MRAESPADRAARIADEVAALEGLGRIERALVYASRLHRGQARKGGGIPYLSHLLGVCALVQEAEGGEDAAIGALLHDAVEDHDAAPAGIAALFGEAVAAIVVACGDVSGPGQDRSAATWRVRKQGYVAHLAAETREEVLRVCVADKLHNARTILSDHLRLGEAVWDSFHVGRLAQLWYYRRLAEVFRERLPGDSQAKELCLVVDRLVRAAGRPGEGEESEGTDRGTTGMETRDPSGPRPGRGGARRGYSIGGP